MDSPHRVGPRRAKIGAALFPDFRGVRVSEGITGAVVCSHAGEMLRSNLGLEENCCVLGGMLGRWAFKVASSKMQEYHPVQRLWKTEVGVRACWTFFVLKGDVRS